LTQKANTASPSLITTILTSIPGEAAITRIEYEGPRIALFSKNPTFLLRNNQIISELVNTLRKRVVVRTDESIRKNEEEARAIVAESIPPEAGATNIFFDRALGELTLEVRRPDLLNSAGVDVVTLTERTGWKVRLRKAPHIPSNTMQHIYYALAAASEERTSFYRDVGERVFRPRLFRDEEVGIFTLGGFREVGRSCLLVVTKESKILLDCGIKPGASSPSDTYPRLDWAEIFLDELDAVVISHPHLDHVGFLPVLYKYGYKGPVYCTEPTLPMMVLLFLDYVKVAAGEGRPPLYDNRDIREVIRHTITLPYGMVTDITSDVKLVLNNAGHILGSATVHLHVGDGAHNIVYTGDYKFAKTRLLESASWNYPRVETLITESTYGAKEDIMPPREEVELSFVQTLNETLRNGGKVLIPVPAVGRAQEIMLVLDEYMRNGTLMEAPIFVDGMLNEATAIHIAHADYLGREIRERILYGDSNPFLSEYFTVVEHTEQRDEVLEQGPAIIMATSGMLEGGPALHYFGALAPDPKNKIVFVSYQVPGTRGRRVLDGSTTISLPSQDGKIQLVEVKAPVTRIEGFSGHSDYNQIIKFVARLKPKLQRVIVNHGERRKVDNVANAISRIFHVNTLAPDIQELVRLY
jgi:KH/beta-lactamase-domain protein